MTRIVAILCFCLGVFTMSAQSIAEGDSVDMARQPTETTSNFGDKMTPVERINQNQTVTKSTDVQVTVIDDKMKPVQSNYQNPDAKNRPSATVRIDDQVFDKNKPSTRIKP